MAVFRGRIAMVSPWIEPGNFYKFIEKFPDADRIDLCLQVATGLAYLHEKGVVRNDVDSRVTATSNNSIFVWQVFGDLKAQNVLINLDGVAKLTDFGLSVFTQSNLSFSTTQNPGGGSTRWMAPELFEETPSRSQETDLYALAMEILTDTVPFPLLSDFQVIHSVTVKHRTPDRPERLKTGFLRHDYWWSLLERSWDREISVRPKASDWILLDRTLLTQRLGLLSSFTQALCYGCTRDGPLKNLDTGEDLQFDDQGPVFLVPEITRGVAPISQVSAEMSLRALAEFYGSKIGVDILDEAHAKTLQDSINDGLNKRIGQVWHWVIVNTSDFSSSNWDLLGSFFSKLNAVALAMHAQIRLCGTICSVCDQLCLRPDKHTDDIHSCIRHQEISIYAEQDEVKQVFGGLKCHFMTGSMYVKHLCTIAGRPFTAVPERAIGCVLSFHGNTLQDLIPKLRDLGSKFVQYGQHPIIQRAIFVVGPAQNTDISIRKLCEAWTDAITHRFRPVRLTWLKDIGSLVDNNQVCLSVQLAHNLTDPAQRSLLLHTKRGTRTRISQHKSGFSRLRNRTKLITDDFVVISSHEGHLVHYESLAFRSAEVFMDFDSGTTLTFLLAVLRIIQEESVSDDVIGTDSKFFAAAVFAALATRPRGQRMSGHFDRSILESKSNRAEYKRIMDRVAGLKVD
ncbi:hypothetical protein FRC07_004406 [Ceratobasidium sp. 392]|nr:hypothetical protein FRC07_004406 [Ceratobasidium sp. 392]